MIYYRRKILLSLLELFNNELGKIRLFKLLMIFCERQENAAYSFVPYKFGCYSFQANSDLNTLKKYNMVSESKKTWIKKDRTQYINHLSSIDQKLIFEIKKDFESYTNGELLRYTYLKFPYYALNSLILENVLSTEELEGIRQSYPRENHRTLFTIGYEGISIEEYVNKLLKNNIKVLCDVRRNSLSMKYGFSKNQLNRVCESFEIIYKHIPELGIVSEKRKDLESQADYEILFDYYKNDVLANKIDEQNEIILLVRKYGRVALTCFESDKVKCHRSHLAASISQINNQEFIVEHI